MVLISSDLDNILLIDDVDSDLNVNCDSSNDLSISLLTSFANSL